ncbi:MAG: SDR family oxidoreductase [Nanoarchaeota archaeon]
MKALVTGASSGIGYEFAKVLAKNKYDIILVSRNKEKLQKIKKEIERWHKTKVYLYKSDLSKLNEVNKFYQKIKNEDIGILINNAGVGNFGKFLDTPWEKDNEVINLNIKALTFLTKIFSEKMVEKGEGKILNVASVAAFQPGPYLAVYSATKSYVLYFSEALAEELKGTGVTVTTLCPGLTMSSFFKRSGISDDEIKTWGNLTTAKEIAEYGYEMMMKNKTIAVYGLRNIFSIFLKRFLPRNFVTKITGRVLKV